MQKTAQGIDKNESPVIVIAGAAGMIGSHLCEALVEMGSKIIGLDDLHTGSEENLKNLRGNPNFDFIETNIAETIPASLHKKQISHIVHVANTLSHLGRQDLELSQLLVNSHGTKNLLDLAQKKDARLVYTSSIDIYRGLASHRNLDHYYDGLEVSAYYSFIEAKRYGEALAKEYWDSYGVDVRIARLAQIYGPRMDLDDGSTLARLTRLALKEKNLVIDEEGSREHLLIYVSDVVYGLTKLLFSDKEDASGGIFNLANPEHVSTLSIAYTLRGLIDEDLKVEFMPSHQGFKLPAPPEVDITRSEKVLFWKPEVDLTEGLERTMKSFINEKTENREQKADIREQKTEDTEDREQKTEDREQKTENTETQEESGWLSNAHQAQQKAPDLIRGLHSKKPNVDTSRLKKVLAGTLVALFILLLPAILTTAFAGGAYFNLKDGDFHSAKSNFLRAEQTAQFIPQSSLSQLMLAGYFGADTLGDFQKAAQEITPLTKDLLTSWQNAPQDTPRQLDTDLTDQEIKTRVENAQQNLRQAESNFALMQTQLERVESDWLSQLLGLDQKVIKLRENIDKFEPIGAQAADLAGFLPTLLGYSPRHQYLILLQNNTELRPTGGFIGSYIVFSLDNGQFSRFKVDDIYNPDGLLEKMPEVAQTPAPAAIQKHMGVKYLGARDANWWPNFTKSAPEIIRLYEQATGENIDTVIGVNLSLLQDILKITGPVYLEEYQENISSDNVFERAEIHAEVGFAPGSDGKKSFLATLARELMKQLTQPKAAKRLQLAGAVAENLKQKDVLVYSSLDNLQQIFINGGWAGELRSSTGDYLYVVDSNVGGNKANFWVNRSTDYDVDVDREGNLTGNLEITWKHNSKSTTWPSGDYKNFARIYFPDGVELVESSGFEDDTLSVKCQVLNDKCEAAGLVKVPIDSTKTVSIRYRLPGELSFAARENYQLLVQKQPGIENEAVEFSLNLPTFLSSPVQTRRSFTLSEDKSFRLPISGRDILEKGID